MFGTPNRFCLAPFKFETPSMRRKLHAIRLAVAAAPRRFLCLLPEFSPPRALPPRLRRVRRLEKAISRDTSPVVLNTHGATRPVEDSELLLPRGKALPCSMNFSIPSPLLFLRQLQYCSQVSSSRLMAGLSLIASSPYPLFN